MVIDGTDIRMVRGDTEDLLVSMENHEREPVDFISGDILYLTVKTNAGTNTKEFQVKVTTFANGEAVIPIKPSHTKNMSFGRYVYDIQLNRTSGEVKTIVPYSYIIIGEEITDE